jgi:polyhydroxybutyrate depolymerase
MTAMRSRGLLVASSASLALSCTWIILLVVGIARAHSGIARLIARPDRFFGWEGAPQMLLLTLLASTAAVLLAFLAIGLRTALRGDGRATAGAVLLVVAGLSNVLLYAFPSNPRAYAESAVRGAAAMCFIWAVPFAALAFGMALRRSGHRGSAWFSIASGITMIWMAVQGIAVGALIASPQPQATAALGDQAIIILWSFVMGLWLLKRRRTFDHPQVLPPPRVGVLGKGLGGVGVLWSTLMVADLLLIAFIVAPAIRDRISGRTQLGAVQIGAVTRSYRVYRPAEMGARPSLVIVLHGAWGDGFQAELHTGFNAQADRLHWIVAYPDGVADGWDTFGDTAEWGQHPGVDDVAFIAALIDRFEASDGIDSERVYVTGFSRGAMMAYRIGCELSARVAAIAPVSGNMATTSGNAGDVACKLDRPVSVLAIHGSADPIVPVEGGRTDIVYAPLDDVIKKWRALDGCVAAATMTVVGSSRTTAWTCAAGSAVEMRVVAGGVHAWPGSRGNVIRRNLAGDSFNASALIADFFAAHGRAQR